MKKLLFGIFICLCSIFVMSQNVGAIDFVVDLDNYSLSRNDERRILDLSWNNNTSCLNVNYCEVFDSSNISRVNLLKNGVNATYNNNSIVVWRVLVGSQLHDGYSNSVSLFNQKNFTTNNDNLIFLGYNQKTVDSNDVYTNLIVAPDNSYVGSVVSTYHNFTIYEYYFKVLQGGQYKIGFESIGSSTTSDIFDLTAYSNSKVMFMSLSVQAWNPVQSKQEEAAEKEIESSENIENQTPPSQNETGDGQSATNLIGAFSGFVSALGGLSATNCNLTLNFPDFAGGSRVVNVCQNKDKAGNIISVFSSLTLIIFYVPLAIRLLTMIYNEIRSFTNG